MKVSCKVNGVYYQRDVTPETRLLDFLRNELGLKGTKQGCDQAECGACSVILNNKLVASCLILVCQIPPDSKIITIESQDSVVTQIQEAFINTGAAQCGACTPAMIMAATALLKENPSPDDEEIREGLSGVLCRCTGYTKIFDAVNEVKTKLE
jgi:carbon-monoxide dehydrogenase small subunit